MMKTILMCTILLVSSPIFSAGQKDGSLMPPLKLQSDQGEINFADYRGKVVLLDFWASWCGPCRQSFPWMNEVQARYEDQGLVVIAVNLDKERTEALTFLSKIPADFKIAYDPEGHSAELMKVMGMPMSYLIDRDGRIRQSLIGFNQSKTSSHEAHIRALLDET